MHWGNKSVDDVKSPETEYRQDAVNMAGHQLAKISCQTITQRGASIHISSEAAYLGVVIKNELKLVLHIRCLFGRCFYHLQQLRSIWCSQMQRRHQCAHPKSCWLLQRRVYVTLTIWDELYWLPVQQRFVYKLCNFVYRCFHQSASLYLSFVCVRVNKISGQCHLRLAARCKHGCSTHNK